MELESAANACALSEIWFGRAAGVSNLVAITVSEGIGTGIIANGRLITGQNGVAGEFGHVPLDPEGPLCSCGNRGCWEVLASNSAALRYYMEARPRRNARQEQVLGFQDLLVLAEQGDVLAARAHRIAWRRCLVAALA